MGFFDFLSDRNTSAKRKAKAKKLVRNIVAKTTTPKATPKTNEPLLPPDYKLKEVSAKDRALAVKLNERFKRYEKFLVKKYRAFATGFKNPIQIRYYVPAQLSGFDSDQFRPVGAGGATLDKMLQKYFGISWEDFQTMTLKQLDKVFFKKGAIPPTLPPEPEPSKPKAEPKPKPVPATVQPLPTTAPVEPPTAVKSVFTSTYCRVEIATISGKDTVRIIFDYAPSEVAKASLKSYGFRYYTEQATKLKYWGAYYTEARLEFANSLCGTKVKKESATKKAEPKAPAKSSDTSDKKMIQMFMETINKWLNNVTITLNNEQYKQYEKLEDDNKHTEMLIYAIMCANDKNTDPISALTILNKEVLSVLRYIDKEHDKIGSITEELRELRYEINSKILVVPSSAKAPAKPKAPAKSSDTPIPDSTGRVHFAFRKLEGEEKEELYNGEKLIATLKKISNNLTYLIRGWSADDYASNFLYLNTNNTTYKVFDNSGVFAVDDEDAQKEIFNVSFVNDNDKYKTFTALAQEIIGKIKSYESKKYAKAPAEPKAPAKSSDTFNQDSTYPLVSKGEIYPMYDFYNEYTGKNIEAYNGTKLREEIQNTYKPLALEANDDKYGVNVILIETQTTTYELLDNSSEFKLFDHDIDKYIGVFEMKNAKGKLLSFKQIAKEIYDIINSYKKTKAPAKPKAPAKEIPYNKELDNTMWSESYNNPTNKESIQRMIESTRSLLQNEQQRREETGGRKRQYEIRLTKQLQELEMQLSKISKQPPAKKSPTTDEIANMSQEELMKAMDEYL